jgi:hypothetical protein
MPIHSNLIYRTGCCRLGICSSWVPDVLVNRFGLVWVQVGMVWFGMESRRASAPVMCVECMGCVLLLTVLACVWRGRALHIEDSLCRCRCGC